MISDWDTNMVSLAGIPPFDNFTAYAKTGVDFISVGALTHSATAVDLSMKIVANSN